LDTFEDRIQPSVSLGAAGNYAVLGLMNTQVVNSNVFITGNEGVSQGGKLNNMAPSTITGNAVEYAAGQYSGPGKLGGSLIIDPSTIGSADSDALAAAAQASALVPTVTFGTISSPQTLTGNGGENVIQVNGDIKSTLILNGTANDVFIVNVTGSVSLGGSTTLGLAGGVTADHVLYNFTGASGSISTHVGNVLNGTLLAPKYSMSLDGVFNGEIIAGGKSITLLSGAKVNGVPFNPPQSTDTASVSGQLQALVTGGDGPAVVAFSGASVSLTDAQGKVVASTITADDGTFTLTGVPAGTFTLTISLPGGYSLRSATAGSGGGADFNSSGVDEFGNATTLVGFTDVVVGDGATVGGYSVLVSA
jgi:hypothetical protein